MEFPARLTLVERALAAALVAAALAAAWVENRSPVAAAVRAGKPVEAWLALQTPTDAVPQLFLLHDLPARGTAEVIFVPETTPVAGKMPLARVYAVSRREGAASRDAAKALADAAEALLPQPAGRFYYFEASLGDEERPIAGRKWLEKKARGSGFWKGLRGTHEFEWFRLMVELHSHKEGGLRAAYLPEQKEIPEYFARLAGTDATGQPRETTVEILNATSLQGVATRLTKRLRSGGLDVMTTGNAPARSRTIVYDRIGRPELAARVRGLLGCSTAESATQIDAKRLVDVSVVVGTDCSE